MDLPYKGPTVFGQIPLGKTGEDPIKFPAGLSCYGVQNQRAFPEPETPVTTVMACLGISTLSRGHGRGSTWGRPWLAFW